MKVTRDYERLLSRNCSRCSLPLLLLFRCSFFSSTRYRKRFIFSFSSLSTNKKTGENEQSPPTTTKLGHLPGVNYELLLHKFKLFDHDVRRYGPTAGLTRRERLELAIEQNKELDENALAVKNAFESKVVDENNPVWKYSAWKNNPALDVDF